MINFIFGNSPQTSMWRKNIFLHHVDAKTVHQTQLIQIVVRTADVVNIAVQMEPIMQIAVKMVVEVNIVAQTDMTILDVHQQLSHHNICLQVRFVEH